MSKASRPAQNAPTAHSGAVRRRMPMPAARAAVISWFRFIVESTKMTEISRATGMSIDRFLTTLSER